MQNFDKTATSQSSRDKPLTPDEEASEELSEEDEALIGEFLSFLAWLHDERGVQFYKESDGRAAAVDFKDMALLVGEFLGIIGFEDIKPVPVDLTSAVQGFSMEDALKIGPKLV